MKEIRDLDHLLQSSLLKDCIILDHKITNLTQPGENYGSLMLLVDVKYKGNDQQEKTVSIVAKKIPDNEWMQNIFKIHVSYKKEFEFYNTIVPTMTQFQKEKGIKETLDIFPRFYGGRLNLNGSDKVDEDGVILLENLKVSGFITGDRKEGFDLDTTKLLLKNLAIFHAVPLALKCTKPQCFKEKILPHIIVKHIPLINGHMDEETREIMIQEKIDIARENEETASLIERISNAIKRCEDFYTTQDSSPREPFATIVHNDFWVNNAMLKYSNSKPTEGKIIDFQIMELGSPCKDLIFFLFSSVQIPVVKEHYDHLVELYYNTFIKTLSELSCDTGKFSFEEFENEMSIEAKNTEFLHALIMLKPIYEEKEATKELRDLSEHDLKSKISVAYKEKAWFIMKEFAKRNWI